MQDDKDIIFAPIKGRVYKYLIDNNITQSYFFEKTGVSPSSFKSKAKLSEFGGEILARIAAEFPEISPDWLLLGREKHINELRDITFSYIQKGKTVEKKHETQLIPLYDFPATAGLKELLVDNSRNIIEHISIPNLPKVDGAVTITGDSMYPLLKSGDIIVFKEVKNLEYLSYGEIHILSYCIDGDEYTVVKYVKKSEEKGYIQLVSYNTHHSPQDIPVSAIRAIGIVKASIRYNTMH